MAQRPHSRSCTGLRWAAGGLAGLIALAVWVAPRAVEGRRGDAPAPAGTETTASATGSPGIPPAASRPVAPNETGGCPDAAPAPCARALGTDRAGPRQDGRLNAPFRAGQGAAPDAIASTALGLPADLAEAAPLLAPGGPLRTPGSLVPLSSRGVPALLVRNASGG